MTARVALLAALALLLGWAGRAFAAEPLSLPYTFTQDGYRVEVHNVEVGWKNDHFLVHGYVTNPGTTTVRVDWQSLFVLHLSGNRTLYSNFDALVDRGGGLTRTSGPFPVEPGQRYRFMVPFLLYPKDFPVRLEIVGHGETAEIHKMGI